MVIPLAQTRQISEAGCHCTMIFALLLTMTVRWSCGIRPKIALIWNSFPACLFESLVPNNGINR